MGHSRLIAITQQRTGGKFVVHSLDLLCVDLTSIIVSNASELVLPRTKAKGTEKGEETYEQYRARRDLSISPTNIVNGRFHIISTCARIEIYSRTTAQEQMPKGETLFTSCPKSNQAKQEFRYFS